MRNLHFEKVFWDRVSLPFDTTDEDCWEWKGCIAKTGYGMFSPQFGVSLYAHRFAWELKHGPVPAGLFICHKCDQRNCVNPSHLFAGTHRDNMRDALLKGRSRPHGKTPLGRNNYDVIHGLYWSGKKNKYELAAQFGVDQAAIWRIVHRKTVTQAL